MTQWSMSFVDGVTSRHRANGCTLESCDVLLLAEMGEVEHQARRTLTTQVLAMEDAMRVLVAPDREAIEARRAQLGSYRVTAVLKVLGLVP